MLKGQPKGLIAAALANMGERFGFYTMMAILLLFLMAKFGLSSTDAGLIYSIFYFSIYILAFVGGIIADKLRNYKGTILVGLILMAVGYAMIAIPSPTPVPNKTLFLALTCFGLFVIAFGNGLFKGNLQALVGQMYDNPQYAAKRDSGFSLFYMFINVGSIFAPMTAVGIRNWWVERAGYTYNADVPQLCHGFIDGTNSVEANEKLANFASQIMGADPNVTLDSFARGYLNIFNEGFHYAFAVAILAMGVSLWIYLKNKKNFPNPAVAPAKGSAAAKAAVAEMDVKEVKQRIWALMAVFAVVIFFWFSFHQNGVTLTLFAKDYTQLELFGHSISAELFQSFNPFFVVFLTPVVLALFGWLRARGKEPSTPKKIAIGMAIAACGFAVMAFCSQGLPLKSEVTAMGVSSVKVTPWLLIVTYLILTIAELFISPLGISFVSKVAPPKYQGLMQGGWLGATAIGNQLLFIGTILYEHIPIWLTWTVFVVACTISMMTMIFMLKWLEKVSK